MYDPSNIMSATRDNCLPSYCLPSIISGCQNGISMDTVMLSAMALKAETRTLAASVVAAKSLVSLLLLVACC